MKRRETLLAFLASAIASAISSQAAAANKPKLTPLTSVGISRLGVYLAVSNVPSAKAFYNELLQKLPTIETGAFVAYDFCGSVFALASKSSYAASSTVGNNAVPYLMVENIDKTFLHVSTVTGARLITDKVLDEGSIKIIKIEDPDGNVLEFYELSGAAAQSFSSAHCFE